MALHKKRLENVYENYKRITKQLSQSQSNSMGRMWRKEMESMRKLEERMAAAQANGTAEESELNIQNALMILLILIAYTSWG